MLEYIKPFRDFKKKETQQEREDFEDLNELYDLPQSVLDEVVREGELKVSAQFSSFSSSERRGYSLSSLLLTFCAASLAGWVTSDQASATGVSAALGSIGFFIAGMIAVTSIWPRPAHSPGNHPRNWKKDFWNRPKYKRLEKWAKIEQCKVLQCQISENFVLAKRRALMQRISISVAFLVAFLCGALLFCWPVF